MDAEQPDIKLAGFSLWVLGRQLPDANDYSDGNWLTVHARVEANQATVEATGPIIHASELKAFTEDLERLNDTMNGEANLACMEPNLGIGIKSDPLGHMSVTVQITPDHMSQSHKFIFDVDQSYLTDLLRRLRSILGRWPIKGTSGQ